MKDERRNECKYTSSSDIGMSEWIQCAEPVVEGGGGGGRTRELGEFSFPSEPFKDNRIDCRQIDELLQLLLPLH